MYVTYVYTHIYRIYMFLYAAMIYIFDLFYLFELVSAQQQFAKQTQNIASHNFYAFIEFFWLFQPRKRIFSAPFWLTEAESLLAIVANLLQLCLAHFISLSLSLFLLSHPYVLCFILLLVEVFITVRSHSSWFREGPQCLWTNRRYVNL